MGIHCEINLSKSADQEYTPGSAVSGRIKYCLDGVSDFTTVVVSLKGRGVLELEYNDRESESELDDSYRISEDYVDVDSFIRNKPLPKGSYEIPFSFELPHNIPGSIKYYKKSPKFSVWCSIKYYVRIKFITSGMLSFNKHFKKKITVKSVATPILPTEPTVYEEQKQLTQLRSLFSSKKSIVNINATIANSVVKPGERVKINYEIANDTNLTLNGVKIRLVQVDTFTPSKSKKAKIVESVKDTDLKYGAVQSYKSKSFSDEIEVPVGLASFCPSKIISRDYFISITAIVPLPHRNLVLEIPLQVIDTSNGTIGGLNVPDEPPSYWEIMREAKKEKPGKSRNDSTDEE